MYPYQDNTIYIPHHCMSLPTTSSTPPPRPFSWAHRRMGPASSVERLPQEVIERICQLLPASSKTRTCLSLVRTSKLWYAPAIRELFASVTLDNQDHAQGALSTLSADRRTDGALALTVRKVCLVIGDEASRYPPPPPRIPRANLTFAHPHLGAHHVPNALFAGILGIPPPGVAIGAGANLGGLPQLTPLQLQHLQTILNPQALHNLPPNAEAQIPGAAPAAAAQHVQQTTSPAEDGWALEPPSFQQQQLAVDAILQSTDSSHSQQADAGSSAANGLVSEPNPLQLSSALDFLSQTNCIQALTIRLPTAEILDERTMSVLTSLPLLRKLDIAGKLTFAQLWSPLKSLPSLEDLTVSGLSTGEEVDLESYKEDCQATTLHLHSLAVHRSELDADLLHGILQSCGDSMTSLKLSRFVTNSRLRFKAVIQMIGPSLRSLAIHRLVFMGPVPLAAEAHLLHILDDLPTYCPMLEELQVAAERIVSPVNFFSTVLPSLFLTQLDLDYYYPMVSEAQIMALIQNLPAGRTETISFGSKMSHLNTPKVQRACQEIGIVVLGAGDM